MRTFTLALSLLANLVLLVSHLRMADRMRETEDDNLRMVDEAEDVRMQAADALSAIATLEAALPSLREELARLDEEASHLG